MLLEGRRKGLHGIAGSKSNVGNRKAAGDHVASAMVEANIQPRMPRRGKISALRIGVKTGLDGNPKLVGAEEQQCERCIWAKPKRENQLGWFARRQRASDAGGEEGAIIRRVSDVVILSLPDVIAGLALEREMRKLSSSIPDGK